MYVFLFFFLLDDYLKTQCIYRPSLYGHTVDKKSQMLVTALQEWSFLSTLLRRATRLTPSKQTLRPPTRTRTPPTRHQHHLDLVPVPHPLLVVVTVAVPWLSLLIMVWLSSLHLLEVSSSWCYDHFSFEVFFYNASFWQFEGFQPPLWFIRPFFFFMTIQDLFIYSIYVYDLGLAIVEKKLYYQIFLFRFFYSHLFFLKTNQISMFFYIHAYDDVVQVRFFSGVVFFFFFTFSTLPLLTFRNINYIY